MKKALAVILVVAMSLTFVTTALAEDTVEVPLGDFTWVNNDNQKGWRVNGMDDVVTDLEWEVFAAAQGLTFTVNNLPEGENIALVFQGDGTPGWPWSQHEVPISTVFTENAAGTGGVFTFEFSDHPAWAEIKTGTIGKFIIGYWGDGTGNMDSLGFGEASLYGVPAALVDGPGEPDEPGEPEDPELAGAGQWALEELRLALDLDLVPVDFIGNWAGSTSRADAAGVLVQIIEKVLQTSVIDIAEANEWDLTTNHFDDTDDGAVTFLKYAGVTTGIGDNKYNPGGTYTRAEIVTMIGRTAEAFFGAIMEGDNPFNDMDGFSWAASFVSYAVDVGITRGNDLGGFNPGGTLQNQMTIVFLYRAFVAWEGLAKE